MIFSMAILIFSALILASCSCWLGELEEGEEETPLLPRVSACNLLLLSAEQEESRERLSQNAESVSGLKVPKLAFFEN